MAIYHVHVASGGRAAGQSAALKVAYILREGPHGGHDDLVEWGSGHMPQWAAADPRKLFAAADAHERKNARLYLHVWVALPNELDEIERHDLVLAIGATLTASGPGQEHGLPYVYAVHAGDPKSSGEAANPHAHYVISERINDEITRDDEQWFRRANRRNPAAGGAPKDRSLKEVTWVEDTRKVIEGLINKHLAWAGREERVTADSHATRIAEADAWGDTGTAEYLRLHPPGIHLGPASAAMERDRFRGKRDEEPELARAGEPTERGELARARAAEEDEARGELVQVARRLEGARRELRWATYAADFAQAIGLTDDEIVRVHTDAESGAEGSGWSSVYEVAIAQGDRGEQLAAKAKSRGIGLAAVYEDAAARGENGVAALERVIGIFDAVRSVRLTVKEIRRIREEADSSQRGGSWGAVEESVRTRSARKERLEAAAAAVGVTDIESVYVAAESRGEDPLTALEELTAEWAAGLEELGGQPGGRELYIAWRTELYPDVTNVEGKEVQGAVEWDRVRLERARAVFENRWGRIHYVAATGALGDRFSLENFDAAVTEADAFDRRAGDLSDGVGRVELEAVTGEGRNPTVAELAAALERGEEAERTEEAERKRATARRGAAVRRREAAVRKTGSGQAWLTVAKEDVLQGADRRPTLEERERIVTAAVGWFREELDRRRAELRSTKEGARFLDEAQRSAGAVKTLAAEEQLVDAAADQLRELLWKQPGGKYLHTAVLTGLDPEWRDSDRSVTLALSDSERLGHLRDVLAERDDAARFRKALAARGENITVQDIDAAVDTVVRDRAAAEARRRAEEQQRCKLDLREVQVRATRRGPGWLSEAKKRVLRGADREPTLEEHERIVQAVEGWIREDLDRRKKKLRSTEQDARFLDEAQPSTGAVTTLAAEEQLVDDAANDTVLRERAAAEARRQAEERQRRELDRREARVRATRRGPGWLSEAKRRVLRGADREPTLEEHERIVQAVEGWIREDLDRRKKKLRSTEQDARFLDEAQPSTGAVTTLAAEEQLVDAANDTVLRERAAAEARRQAEERQRRELDRREARVRATCDGEQRLKREQVARFGEKRSLTLEEQLSVVETVEMELRQEVDAREVAIQAEAGGGALLERVKGRRGAPQDLAEREGMIGDVEQVFRAADEAEAQVPTTLDPKRSGCRVPVIFDALLDAVVAEDDDPFVGDVVVVLRARHAQRTLEGVAEGGYAAAAREESARRHFGSTVVDAMKWCVLKVREIILAACHKILGGGGESGKRVQASLEAAGAERKAQQSAVESAAQNVVIDVGAFARSALGDGRDPVSVLEEETARRHQVLSNAAAFGVDIQAEFEAGGFAAIEAATEQWQEAISTAKDLGIQVDAVTAAARSTGKDPLEALKKETAWAETVRSYAEAIGFPRSKFEAVFAEGETRRLNSGYTAVWEECVRTTARKEVRKVLPFEGPDRARPGALVPAISDAWSRELLREIQEDAFAQDILREVLAESAGSDEERATAGGFYHKRQVQVEHEKWFSSKPTEEEARQVVLARFIPVLAERVRQACAQVQDLDGLTARMVEEDRARRVKGALKKTLPQETPPGYGSPSIAVSDQRFSRIAERTSNASVQELISTTYLEGLSSNDYGRAQAEEIHLRRRIREKEESGLRRDQAAATAHEEYAIEVQHQIERIFREIESRSAEEILRERARRDGMPAARPGYGVDRTDEHGRKHTDRSEGWSW